MASLIPGFEYDIFISYRHKDNKGGHWVTEFVDALRTELEATFKEDISIYFDENPYDGVLETHNVDKSLEGKLKCLIFIPIISQTYCDPKSFAWQNEFLVFNKMAKEDQFGSEVKLSNGNVASRVLPVRIHDINAQDKALVENELGPLRSIDFILKSAGINRPLTSKDDEVRTHGQILYRNQINKVANALKEIVYSLEIGEPKSTENLSRPIQHRSQSIEPPSKPSTKKILAICVGALILVLLAGYFIFNFTTIRAKFLPTNLDKSIAVLSFKNIGKDKNDEYFSDGMTEEITNNLAKVGDLKVISSTSVEQYKGAKKDIRTIANELGVSYILAGSIRKADKTFRISIQLIEAETGFHLWSDEYDREITDVLQVERDISKEVIEVLKIILTASERENIENAQPVELAAYGLYLRARSELMNYRLTGQTKQEHLKNAIALFKSSLDGDPKFARAYSGLGLALIYKYFHVPFTGTTLLDSAKMLAEKALQLDDKTEEAHYVKSVYFYPDVNKAISECKQALEINPNYADALLKLGEMNNLKGDFVSGLSQMERAIQLGRGPELAGNLRMVSAAYSYIGLYDKSEEFSLNAFRLDKDSAQLFARKSGKERIDHNYQSALRFANKALLLDSSNWGYFDQKAWLHSLLGEHREALDAWLNWNDIDSPGGTHNRIGYSYWVLGNKKKAYEYFNRMIEFGNEANRLNWVEYYDLAGTYAFLGEKEKAYLYLDEVNKENFYPFWLIALIKKEDPLFQKIRNEDHFKNIVQQMEEKSNAERNRVIKWLEKEGMKAKVDRD